MTPELLLKHSDEATLCPQGCGLDVGVACERALSVRQLRIARGEQPRGYKIGFTNRTIWERYGVYAPMWGPVWDTTVAPTHGTEHRASLAGLVQPRLEP